MQWLRSGLGRFECEGMNKEGNPIESPIGFPSVPMACRASASQLVLELLRPRSPLEQAIL